MVFGADGRRIPGVDLKDFNILCEFATHGITPQTSPFFRLESINIPPLRDRYILLQHPINRLLYKQYTDGTLILLSLKDAQTIPDIHFSPQHHADSKERKKDELLVIYRGSMIQRTLRLMAPLRTKILCATS